MSIHSHHIPQPPVGRRPDRPMSGRRAGQSEEPSDRQADGFFAILRGYPLALGVTLLTAAVFVAAMALALYYCQDPSPLVPLLSGVALGLACLCGGIAAGKGNPTRPLGAGLVCGGLTTLLLCLLSLLTGGGGGLFAWVMRLSAWPIHLLGGLIGRAGPRSPTHRAGTHRPVRRP